MLEAWLAVLPPTTESAESAAVETDGETTQVRPLGRKTRVALESRLTAERVKHLLTGMRSAMVFDDRPPRERRGDPCARGQRSQITHNFAKLIAGFVCLHVDGLPALKGILSAPSLGTA
jgi:hypothetical protein